MFVVMASVHLKCTSPPATHYPHLSASFMHSQLTSCQMRLNGQMSYQRMSPSRMRSPAMATSRTARGRVARDTRCSWRLR